MLTRRGLFLHTLVAVLLGHVPPPGEKAALDRAILAVYRNAGITADPSTHSRPAPLLADLTAILETDADPASKELAARLAPWVVGSFKDLSTDLPPHPEGHLVVWSLRHLPDELRTVGSLFALDHIGRQVDLPPQYRDQTAAARVPRRRLVVVDEGGCSCATAKAPGSCSACPRPPQTQRRPDRGHPGRRRRARHRHRPSRRVPTPPPRSYSNRPRKPSTPVGDAFGLTVGEGRLLLPAPAPAY